VSNGIGNAQLRNGLVPMRAAHAAPADRLPDVLATLAGPIASTASVIEECGRPGVKTRRFS
jgi:hypothetical protein